MATTVVCYWRESASRPYAYAASGDTEECFSVGARMGLDRLRFTRRSPTDKRCLDVVLPSCKGPPTQLQLRVNRAQRKTSKKSFSHNLGSRVHTGHI